MRIAVIGAGASGLPAIKSALDDGCQRLYTVSSFDLERHIRFGHEVRAIRRNEKYSETGQWDVEWHDYRTNNSATEGFEDQTVVVVGIGNSGADIAVELSKISKKV
uniref:Flavin-containing monooxygenase n=1 Tax=Heterorhabditis bacteriophora TaxID=37862 RepID=A0A1I7XCZ8_HETBA